MVKYGILGGGWAGLLIADAIKREFPNAEIDIIEKSAPEELGGLLRSVTIDGFTYDIGGPHILFSRNKKTLDSILKILDGNDKMMERKNYIHFDGKLIPYPFENGIYMLPERERAEIGYGIVNNLIRIKGDKDWSPDTFYDWIYGIFGEEMGTRYLEPYNRKIWKRDLTNFDADWVFTPGRLPLPDLKDIIYSISGISTVGYKEQANFYYPRTGGIQTLYDSLKAKIQRKGIKIITETEISKIEQEESGGWTLNESHKYDKIVNTLPLTILLKVLNSPPEVMEVSKKLDHNRVMVVGYALDQEAPDRIALYVPDKEVIFHRYTWMSNLVSGSPSGKSNIIVEVTWPKDLEMDPDYIVRSTTEGLLKLGIISSREKIIHTNYWVHEFGYPVYIKGHSKVREEIFTYLDRIGVKSVGRWGSWHYWNTDKVFEAVERILDEIKQDSNSQA